MVLQGLWEPQGGTRETCRPFDTTEKGDEDRSECQREEWREPEIARKYSWAAWLLASTDF
ncbi:hypothetical protein BDP55DRAFT_668143 [Colletotrichum godetiae]|uniref:Uncharacterized protein n=1 Tax=Colletotrichum godetiae TaxID=1209918 RepID=A0AAJ0ESS3_9PEZI|nr:uncharacterized protein BDP55DRAFT_668143 [Colletotrichum godetiae]KAK1674212.1 hypothetical protein BDP55DRAFT_668143 [Colletotrichum godetiae]